MVDATVILAGAIPAACLALALDGALTLIERLVRRALSTGRGSAVRAVALAAALLAAFAAVAAYASTRAQATAIVVGSKNFTEQIVLGELLAQVIETRAGLPVRRRLNLGGTFICDRAVRSGDIDLYVEYSGTAHAAIFHRPSERDPSRVLDDLRNLYAQAGLTLLPPLGFENTFAILIRGDDAARLDVHTIDDAAVYAPRWTPGFGYEFLQRADGFAGLSKTYGLRFAAPPRAMDLSLIYRALAERQVDLIAGDATSGLIEAYGLTMLRDTRRYFPPYDAVPVARTAVLLAHPELRDALAGLAGRITVGDMRRMNHAVDAEHRDPADVARDFLNRVRGP